MGGAGSAQSQRRSGVEFELRSGCRREVTPVRGEDPTEGDGKTAPRLSPTLYPPSPPSLSFVIPRCPLCVVRVFSCWPVWFEPHEEVAEHATGEDGHQQPSRKDGIHEREKRTLMESILISLPSICFFLRR